MLSLEKSLKDWVANGVLPPEQAERIRKFETKKPKGRWMMAGILTLAFFIIGFGLILLTSVNWQNISTSIKLGTDGFLFLLSVFGIIWFWKTQKNILFEGSLIFFLIFCMSSLLLIDKVFSLDYQTSYYPLLLIWSLFTFLPALISRKLVVPFLWGTGTFIGFAFLLLRNSYFEPFFQNRIFIVFMLLTLLYATIFLIGKTITKEAPFLRAFKAVTFIAGCVSLLVADASSFRVDNFNMNVYHYIPGYILSVLATFLIWKNKYKSKQKIFLLCILVSFLVYFHLIWFGITAYLAYAISTIFILSLCATFFVLQKNRALFQIFLILIGTRIAALYFQAASEFAKTGVGLVIAGLLLLLLIFVWNKYHRKFNSWLN